ncbi:S1C family serine protease [Clostridium sp. HCP1S3_B4]|uniref:S1C family serine protease n=1 Tax=unclassified Clostridium TaxID=2614128 RepID=UPI003F897E6B|nr:trypsin-like peptidase domain-containing protein [Clostridiales bacterium]
MVDYRKDNLNENANNASGSYDVKNESDVNNNFNQNANGFNPNVNMNQNYRDGNRYHNANNQNYNYGSNQSFNRGTNNNFNNMNNRNNYSGMNNSWNDNNIKAAYKVENDTKPKNGFKKVIALVAAGLVIAVGGGVLGGAFTYTLMGKSNSSTAKNVDPSSYAAPEFTSSTDGSLSVSEAFQKVAPAVVTITTTSLQASQYGNFSQEVEGIGSGFIINEDGYILTNYHVVKGSQQVKVLLSTGDEVDAKVVNYDQERDMAVVKLADGTKVPGVAELGDSDALYAGEDVIAIGTPLSTEFAQTCTKGIVSAVNRNVTTSSGATMKVIQTDTAINPGNSGGPLINTKGQVIGINSMKLVEDTVEGIGFSIPINEAKERIETLSKPILSLGVTVMEVTEEKSQQSGYPQGLYVKGIEQGSAAEKAGISVGDVIIGFDGKDIKTSTDLTDAKAEKNAGDTVEVVVYRNKKNVKLQLQLEESN